MQICNAEIGDSLFLSCGKENEITNILSQARTKIAEELRLIDENQFVFCWIVDYPMFEMDEKQIKLSLAIILFSMPQGDINVLNFDKPLDMRAYQYDIVCNGVELSSGAIRNHIQN